MGDRLGTHETGSWGVASPPHGPVTGPVGVDMVTGDTCVTQERRDSRRRQTDLTGTGRDPSTPDSLDKRTVSDIGEVRVLGDSRGSRNRMDVYPGPRGVVEGTEDSARV